MGNAVSGFKLLIVIAIFAGMLGCVSSSSRSVDKEAAIDARVAAARKYIAVGEFEDAKRHLRKLNDLAPNHAKVHDAFALLHSAEGEYELAEKRFIKALSSDAGLSYVRDHYAVFLCQRERYNDAFLEFDLVIKDVLYAHRSQSVVNSGVCYRLNGNLKLAEMKFKKALQLDKNNRLALLELSDITVAGGDYIDAKKYLERYLELRKHNARTLWVGIRLARATDDLNKESSYALLLKQQFATSPEYQKYKQSK